jgi:hypothetical protein
MGERERGIPASARNDHIDSTATAADAPPSVSTPPHAAVVPASTTPKVSLDKKAATTHVIRSRKLARPTAATTATTTIPAAAAAAAVSNVVGTGSDTNGIVSNSGSGAGGVNSSSSASGWADNWRQLVWDRWRWGVLIALAVVLSRIVSV